uniref:Nucleoprotein n=1 Tax=Pinus yunnanensis virus 1 TaxID=2977981 RepID=A0A9N7AAT6_9RHAB|nr:TPA_asm: nucleocapsid protein [Pinus yunnanensis virus 1]
MAGLPEIMVDKEFEDIKTSFTASGTNKTEWIDETLTGSKGFVLKKLTDTELSTLIQDVFPKLETGISEKDAANLMNIAWNIRAPGKISTRIFPEKASAIGSMAAEIDTTDTEVLDRTGYRSAINFTGVSELLICQGGGWFSLCMLRLFVRSDSNMIAAKQSVVDKFLGHYGKAFPIKPFTLNDTVIGNLHSLFQTRERFKWTLAYFLYHMSESTDTKFKGIIEAAFSMHLRDAGMKCWSLFKEVAQKLNSDSALLLTTLKIEATVKGLRCIATMIRNFECDQATLIAKKRERKTYQYARIFDPEMFLDLQTKNCIPLTLTLANLSKKVNPRGTGDVMQMMAIRGADKEVKSIYEKFAQEIYNYYHQSEGCAKGNILFKRAVGIAEPPAAPAAAATPSSSATPTAPASSSAP